MSQTAVMEPEGSSLPQQNHTGPAHPLIISLTF